MDRLLAAWTQANPQSTWEGHCSHNRLDQDPVEDRDTIASLRLSLCLRYCSPQKGVEYPWEEDTKVEKATEVLCFVLWGRAVLGNEAIAISGQLAHKAREVPSHAMRDSPA